MPEKIAFLFPGQGSQQVGMGRDLYEHYPEVRRLFQEADEVLGFALSRLCFEGPAEELTLTANAQPAILTVSVACWQLLSSAGVQPAAVAGHSLGEYSALVAAGSLTFADALRIVRRRGELMQRAVAPGVGGMAAVLGLEREAVEDVCRRAAELGVVEPVNYNCPGQVVIAGEKPALERACELAREKGAARCVPLAVSAPFHSRLMQPAAEGLAEVLAPVTINNPNCLYVSNVTGQPVKDGATIKELLIRQAASPVRWEECVHSLLTAGMKIMIEVGPGKVLCGLVRKIDRRVQVLNVEDKESLEKTLARLGEVG